VAEVAGREGAEDKAGTEDNRAEGVVKEEEAEEAGANGEAAIRRSALRRMATK